MRNPLLALALLLTLLEPAEEARAASEAVSPVPNSARQMLLVRAPHWWSATGSLQRYEREGTASWRPVGEAISVNLGRGGLAWGRGLQPQQEKGPRKREGDGRSPAGVFSLERAFGAADKLPPSSRDFPYLQARDSSYCVEDVRSPHYNELIDSSVVKAESWERWSPLLRPDGLFRWGVVVHQNAPDTVKGSGSCVFLHIWRGAGHPTSGCTAMAPDAIEAVVRWLDPKTHPVLAQLPDPQYRALAEAWQLPAPPAPPAK